MIKDTHISPDINHGFKKDGDPQNRIADTDVGFIKDGSGWSFDFEGL